MITCRGPEKQKSQNLMSVRMQMTLLTPEAPSPEADINDGGPISTFVPWRKLTLEPGRPISFLKYI